MFRLLPIANLGSMYAAHTETTWRLCIQSFYLPGSCDDIVHLYMGMNTASAGHTIGTYYVLTPTQLGPALDKKFPAQYPSKLAFFYAVQCAVECECHVKMIVPRLGVTVFTVCRLSWTH